MRKNLRGPQLGQAHLVLQDRVLSGEMDEAQQVAENIDGQPVLKQLPADDGTEVKPEIVGDTWFIIARNADGLISAASNQTLWPSC